MKRPTELIEKAKGFKSTDPIRVLAEYAVSLEQPRKTVKDAVDYFDGAWGVSYMNLIVYHQDEGYAFCNEAIDGWHEVCTREEFEAEVERRNSTPCKFNGYNKVAFGSNCKIVCGPNAYGSHVIEMEDTGEWGVVLGDAISERKPTISKAEAWDKLAAEMENPEGKSVFNEFYEILEQYEVK